MQKFSRINRIYFVTLVLFVFMFFASFAIIVANTEIALIVNVLLLVCTGQLIMVDVIAARKFPKKNFWALIAIILPMSLWSSCVVAGSNYWWAIGLIAIILPIGFLVDRKMRYSKIVEYDATSRVIKIFMFYFAVILSFVAVATAMMAIGKPLIALYCDIAFGVVSITLFAWLHKPNKEKNRIHGFN